MTDDQIDNIMRTLNQHPFGTQVEMVQTMFKADVDTVTCHGVVHRWITKNSSAILAYLELTDRPRKLK